MIPPAQSSTAVAAAGPASAGVRLLKVRSVSVLFGNFMALDDVSVNLDAGRALGLVGPNGSGKTTLINVVTGLVAAKRGKVFFDREDVGGRAPHRLAHLGINRTFQIPKPFTGLTVLQNVEVAARYGKGGRSVDEILALTRLDRVASRLSEELTVAEQKKLDLARALSTAPRLICVDELGAGLSISELDEVALMLSEVSQRWGIALLVVEHLMGFLQRVTEDVVVLNAGQVIFEGLLGDALRQPNVVQVFLGG